MLRRMSAIDAAWLRMERPTNPMLIVSVTILAGRCTLAALRQLISERFLRHERFRAVPVADALGGTWVPDTSFDLDAHVGAIRLPGRGTQPALERLVGELPRPRSIPRDRAGASISCRISVAAARSSCGSTTAMPTASRWSACSST